MQFEDYVAQTRPRLEAAFRRCLADLFGGAGAGGSPQLIEPLADGKKIRGCLLCLVSDALGGRPESPVSRAVAVELVHAATLVHDDFVDQDTRRRNRPAVWTLQGARRAVLVGDVVFATAVRMMSDLGREDGSVIADAIARVSMGAFQEPLDEQDVIGLIQSAGDGAYERIIGLKTGVLFGAACELGAIAAGASEGVRARLRRYGLRIGEAYQMADDAADAARRLASASFEPGQMAAVAPALLFFAGESQAHRALALAGAPGLDAALRAELLLVTARMEGEVERRIDSALEEVAEVPLAAGLRELIHRAPRDLLLMFRRAH